MSKNYAIIIQFVLLLTTFYRSGAQKINAYKRNAFVTSWRFHNRAWQPEGHDRLPETSGTLWIHRGALTNQRCSLATGCGINMSTSVRAAQRHADHCCAGSTCTLLRKSFVDMNTECWSCWSIRSGKYPWCSDLSLRGKNMHSMKARFVLLICKSPGVVTL